MPKRDNGTLRRKVNLRLRALRELEVPVILETHAGFGRLWHYCYQAYDGVALEFDPVRISSVARQRPTWACYQVDCIPALRAGIGTHLPINFVDIDPYGSPWPVVDALFQGQRVWPEQLVVVVNDGLRQKAQRGGAWDTADLEGAVQRYGNESVYARYLEIAQGMFADKAAQAEYRLSRWTGYYCGYGQQMTHYAAVLTRDGGVK